MAVKGMLDVAEKTCRTGHIPCKGSCCDAALPLRGQVPLPSSTIYPFQDLPALYRSAQMAAEDIGANQRRKQAYVLQYRVTAARCCSAVQLSYLEQLPQARLALA